PALGRNWAAVTTAKVSGRGSIEAIARAMPKWPNCIVSPGRDPGTRWAQCVKPFSSGAILAVPLGLPRSDHFLKQDATNDRRGEDIAARVGREPALPLEQLERRLDGGSLEPAQPDHLAFQLAPYARPQLVEPAALGRAPRETEQQQDGPARGIAGQPGQRLERGGIDPLSVVEGEEHRSLMGGGDHCVAHR